MQTQSKTHIVVFEHEHLDLSKFDDKETLDTLVKFYDKGSPYFSLTRKGVKFNEYVGVIQIGNIVIEVLPKADRGFNNEDTKIKWRDILVNMIRAVHGFDVKAPSSSNLKTKSNSILELYFELFISEVEYLLHRGLVKKYRKTEGNLTVLKGNIQFSKHISKNVVHKERFFTQYTTYDSEHLLHIILYKTIQVLKRINNNSVLVGRINALLLNFPEMPNLKITETTFDKVVLSRKTMGYQKAIEISKLILLNYHPDLSKGRRDVLALMFDMNILWEKFVLVSLKKEKSLIIKGQDSRYFWKPEGGNRRTIRPDITIQTVDGNFVLDTKWKLIDTNPSMDDIRQMYAYHHYFNAKKVALFYPGSHPYQLGNFIEIDGRNVIPKMECGLLFTEVKDSVKDWQKRIVEEVREWIKPGNITNNE
jgi:5-methylcytosine-specific restriction enzyme subunit McrC